MVASSRSGMSLGCALYPRGVSYSRVPPPGGVAMHTHEALTPTTDRVDLAISGMSCASCAARVEKALAGVAGVDSAAVNFATETATVHYDPAQVTTDAMRTAVADIGYSASPPIDHAHPGA